MAVARKLAVLLHRLWVSGEVYVAFVCEGPIHYFPCSGVQHRQCLLASVQITSYNLHLGLLRSEHCWGEHRTVYSGRSEADVVMASIRTWDRVPNCGATSRGGIDGRTPVPQGTGGDSCERHFPPSRISPTALIGKVGFGPKSRGADGEPTKHLRIVCNRVLGRSEFRAIGLQGFE